MRHNWTPEEEKELTRIFHKYFEVRKTPGQKVIENGMAISRKSHGLICHLARDNIKKKISNMIKKLL